MSDVPTVNTEKPRTCTCHPDDKDRSVLGYIGYISAVIRDVIVWAEQKK